MALKVAFIGILCCNFIALCLADAGRLGFVGRPGLPALRGPLKSISLRSKSSPIIPVQRAPSRLGLWRTARMMQADTMPQEEVVGRQLPPSVQAIFDASNTFEVGEIVAIKKADGSR
jgi:hypothetical protein